MWALGCKFLADTKRGKKGLGKFFLSTQVLADTYAGRGVPGGMIKVAWTPPLFKLKKVGSGHCCVKHAEF